MTGDTVVEAVRADLLARSQVGIAKYGVTLDRKDIDLRGWLQHAYEEHLDAANYLKRSIMELDAQKAAVALAAAQAYRPTLRQKARAKLARFMRGVR